MKNKIIWGLLLLAVAVVLILNLTNVITFKEESVRLWDFWPVIFIGIGLTWLFNRGNSKWFALVVILLGGYLIYRNLGYTFFDKKLIAPVILIVIAFSILLSALRKSSNVKVSETSGVYTNVFSGGEVKYKGDIFTHGDISAVFGGTTLDLTNTSIHPDGAYISASVAFGGIDVKVPEGTNVITKGFIFFGGVDHKHESSRIPEVVQNGTLTVEVSGAFGGVDIKYI